MQRAPAYAALSLTASTLHGTEELSLSVSCCERTDAHVALLPESTLYSDVLFCPRFLPPLGSSWALYLILMSPRMLLALAASHTFLGLNDRDIFKGTLLIYFENRPSVGIRLLLSSCLD